VRRLLHPRVLFTMMIVSVVGFLAYYRSVAIEVLTIYDDHHGSPPAMKTGAITTHAQGEVLICKYHGNCPVHLSCVFNTADTTGRQVGGICKPYLGQRNYKVFANDVGHQKCIEACLDELKWDEWHSYGSHPIVKNTFPVSNGHGCIIRYKRKHIPVQQRTGKNVSIVVGQNKFTMGAPLTLEEWIAQRFRRVVRVDPAQKHGEDTMGYKYWNALCDIPCQANRDCADGMVCIKDKQTCQRSDHLLRQEDNDMVIVSGADVNYFSGLRNLAASLVYWAPNHKLVVYNLGMTKDQLEQVKTWPNLLEINWIDGIPKNSYPSHVYTLATYAFKSIIINETVHNYKSIFWLDAGATFTSSLKPLQDIIHQHGIFLVNGQDEDMTRKSHADTYRWFGHEKNEFAGRPHFAGGIQGHVYPSRYIESIVIPNAKCALDPNCIQPKGSNLGNHRFDQTSLSILAHEARSRIGLPGRTEYVAASENQLPDMSKPSRMIIWTARNSCTFYASMDLLDDKLSGGGKAISSNSLREKLKSNLARTLK
jgi:hypothetical protein